MEVRAFNPVQIQSNLMSNYCRYTNFRPAEILRKYIFCYWILPSANRKLMDLSKMPREEIVVPDGCIDILFGNIQREGSCRNIIVGTMSKPILVDMEHEEIETFGIRFYPGGIHAFIKENATVFTNKIEMIEDIKQNTFVELGKRISEINNVYEKIDFTNEYLIGRLIDRIPFEDKFQNITCGIYKTGGKIRIKDIAGDEAISEKQVTRIIKNRIGVNAKEFINIIRFQNALKVINSNKQIKTLDIALETGYYDQSHFIHDFQDYSGMTPSEYIKQK